MIKILKLYNTAIPILLFFHVIIFDHYHSKNQESNLKTQQVERGFTQSVNGMSIAIPDVILLSQQPDSMESIVICHEISAVLYNDITFAGVANVISKNLHPKYSQKDVSKIDLSQWGQAPIRADFLIHSYLSTVSHEFIVNAEVINIRTKKTAHNKSYRVRREEVRHLGHMIAGDLIKFFSGVTGITHSKIAFISPSIGPRDIFSMDYDGKNLRQITRERSVILFPTISLDAKKLAYISFAQGRPFIQVRSVTNGLAIHSFRFSRGSVSSPSFSPDGNLLAFTSSKDSNSMQLYIMNLQTNQLQQITHAHSIIHTSPRWNPQTGREIAFISNESGTPQIYIINIEGMNQQRLLNDGGSADSPTWSPNGQYIAFSWKPNRASHFDIFLMDITSRQIVQLTSRSGSNESPSWSPDGRHLAFQSNRTGRFEIFIMHIDGTNEIQLTNQGGISPIWYQ